MINEVLEVNDYLHGKNIDPKCLFRICYLLAKWFHQQGKSPMEIRQSIFGWGAQYGQYIRYNLNNLIAQAINDPKPLKENVCVCISDDDTDEILRRFDSYNSRLLSLGLLCFAKANANAEREFSVSLSALSSWLKLNRSTVVSRYLPQLIDYDYVRRITDKTAFSWDDKGKFKTVSLQLLVPLRNGGALQLEGNNIIELYWKIF